MSMPFLITIFLSSLFYLSFFFFFFFNDTATTEIYTLSLHDALPIAVVLVLRLVPPIFAAPLGGVVADRLSRRTIMVASDLIRAALILAVPFVGIVGLYVLAFVHECVSLFFLPSRDASIPGLVPDRRL